MKNFETEKQNKQAIELAYFKIAKIARKLISSIEQEPLRAILERQDEPNSIHGHIVYELINPLLYLRLECSQGNNYNIHYGYEQGELSNKYYPITSAFVRLVYRYTSKENTAVNIEDCIHTDWVITNCAELYEYITDRNKFHQNTILDYQNDSIAM